MIECENYYCIYQKDHECMFEEINVNIAGNCESCILVDIPDDILNKLKKEQLKKIESYDKNY